MIGEASAVVSEPFEPMWLRNCGCRPVNSNRIVFSNQPLTLWEASVPEQCGHCYKVAIIGYSAICTLSTFGSGAML